MASALPAWDGLRRVLVRLRVVPRRYGTEPGDRLVPEGASDGDAVSLMRISDDVWINPARVVSVSREPAAAPNCGKLRLMVAVAGDRRHEATAYPTLDHLVEAIHLADASHQKDKS